MQHYQPSGQPWYVQRSIGNNPLSNGLHGGGSNGLESAVNDVNSDVNDVNNGHFGYIGRVAGIISSAIPPSAKRIAAVSGLAALLGLLSLEAACSSPGPIQKPYIPSAPAPAVSQRTQTDRLSELTAQEFITNAKAGKYEPGTVLTVSNLIYEGYFIDGRDMYVYFYFGPKVNGFYVMNKMPQNSSDTIRFSGDMLGSPGLSKGEKVTIRGKYDGLFNPRRLGNAWDYDYDGAILKYGELISVKK